MEIRFNKKINGKGLYATKKYFKDTVVFILSGEIYDHPTRETIHIGNSQHIYDEYGIFMNHSFEPTTHIDGRRVIALTDIQENDEITFDYNASEINMASPFVVDDVLVCGQKV